MCNTISVQSFQSWDSANSGPPSMSHHIFTPKALSTSIVMKRYGMLFGSVSLMTVSSCNRGSAISRPDISCDPPDPDTVTFPPSSFPEIVSGTCTSEKDSCPVPEMVSSLTPNAPMMSLAPFNGLLVNVPSPLTVAFPSPSTAISGIISRARSPDSPALIVSDPNAAAPRPFIVNVELSLTTFPSLYASPTVTSAPRALATEMADSLSPHGEYPFNVVVPSANAAAIIALWAKLLDAGIWISIPPGPLSMSEEAPVSSEVSLAVASTVASAVWRRSAFR